MSFEHYVYLITGWVIIALIWWAFDEIKILVKRIFSKK